ncbi:MAG TPA: helix-turn-helix domain-containing protein [Thermoanaerobaculia bacterium]|nr:helix-turn-helix domain-containing protein [Thermoanaerobaculia bacterium]
MASEYGQFCPVAVACEVFARPWTPIILRELLSGAEQFNQIHHGLPLISRPLLSRRLRELESAGILRREPLPVGRGHSYRLTPAGRELGSVIDALGEWGQRWTSRVDPERLDPAFLIWNMHRRVASERLPDRRIVLRIRFTGVPARHRGPRQFWLILETAQVDVCARDPGFEVDLDVEADLATMARVWLGDLTFEQALRSRKLRLDGSRELTRAFPAWWRLSRFADVPRPGARAGA